MLSISLLVTYWQLSRYKNKYNVEKENMVLCEKANSIAKTQADIIAISDITEAVEERFEYCFSQAWIHNYTWSEARYHAFLLCSTDLQ